MAGVGQFMNDKVYTNTNFSNQNVIPSMVLLDEARKHYLDSRVAVTKLASSSNEAERENLRIKISTNRQKIEDALNHYEYNGCFGVSCVADDTDKRLLYQEKALLNQFGSKLNDAIAEYKVGQVSQAQAAIISSAELSEKIQTTFDQHFDYNVAIGKRSAEQASVEKNESFYLLVIIGTITILVISGIGYLGIRSLLFQLGGEPEDAADIATRLALGDLSSRIQLRPGDRSSLMAKIQQLILTMETVADRADKISRGNLADEVAILSDQDRLGQAINHMVVALRTARVLDERRNWLNNGSNQLSIALTGDYSTDQIAEIALNTICHYLGAGRGVFYALRNNAPVLDLIASYMYTDDMNYRQSFRIGEGAIGQVAQDRVPIILKSINSASAMIVTGTMSALPAATFTYPILKDKKLFGVIEFSSLESFNEIKLDYIAAAIEVLASFLYVAQQRGQINDLLVISEQAERDVRKQNEYLQEINSRMEEQQQQLQQQSEELQQTNAQMEEQHQLLEQKNERLHQSEAEIHEKAKQLELSNHYKSEFLANMSHELRTPLNAIILLSKMMMENPEGKLSDKEIKRAEVIHHSGHDLLALINEVLDLSKVDAGRMEINTQEISSVAMCGELHNLFEATAQNQHLVFDIEDQLQGRFVSDQTKVIQILRNLLSNAFKFTKHGSVTLAIKKIPQAALPIQISVIDTGIGIPKNKHKTIFDAFRQVDGSTSREYGGTGLGLTISLRFAELLGGDIKLISAEGAGSEFILCLPETPPATLTNLPTMIASLVPAKTTSIVPGTSQARNTASDLLDDRNNLNPHDKIILLIDDDVHFCAAVVEINHRLGYKTVVAQTGNEGFALAIQYRPAGILLDLGLPDKDGREVLHEIKSNADIAATPVYIISGRDHDSALNQQDIVGYLQKPLISSQIEQAEAALIDAIQQARANGVLVISSSLNNQVNTTLRAMPSQYEIHSVTMDSSLHQALEQRDWGVAIIDLCDLKIDQGLEVAKIIRSARSKTAILFFGNAHFSDDEEASLRSYTDSIIINAPQAGQRLQENIERFLQNESRHELPNLTSTSKPDIGTNLAHKKILVIDDDPRNLFVITAALEQNQACIFNALNGKRGLEILLSQSIDLVITDIMMPEMDGYETIAAIRSDPKLFAIPIIALTAKAMPEDKQNILEIGADDYLAKPVDYDVLCNMAGFWSSNKHA